MESRLSDTALTNLGLFATGQEPSQKMARIADKKTRCKQFTVEIISATDFHTRRVELVAIVSNWYEYFNRYYSQDNLVAFMDRLRMDWTMTIDSMTRFLTYELSADCFLVYDKNNKLQGIGTSKWKSRYELEGALPTDSFHITNLLTAPWNILPRIRGIDRTETHLQYGVGTALLSAIVEYAAALNAERVTLVPGASDASDVYFFYKKRMFTRNDISRPFMNLTRAEFQDFLLKYPRPAEHHPELTLHNSP